KAIRCSPPTRCCGCCPSRCTFSTSRGARTEDRESDTPLSLSSILFPPSSRMSPSSQPRSTDGPWVGVIMGSTSDRRYLEPGIALLDELGIAHEVRIVSAHRTPDWMFEYAGSAESRGIEVIIAAAGGAAHLPGMVSAKTLVPVLGVPIPATMLNGVDSLLSIVQMPK